MANPIDPLLELLGNIGASQERHGEHARTIRNPLQTAGDNYRRLQDVGQGIAGLLSLPAVATQADWGDPNSPITQYSADIVGRRGEAGSREKFLEALLHPGRLNEQMQHSPDPLTSWLSGGAEMAADPTNLIPLPAIQLGKVLRLQKAKGALLKLLAGVPEAALGNAVDGAAQAATDLPLTPRAADYRKFAAGVGLPIPEAGAFDPTPPSTLTPKNFDIFRAAKAPRPFEAGQLQLDEAAPKLESLLADLAPPAPVTAAVDPLLSAPAPGTYNDFLKLARGVQGELPSPGATFWQRLNADPATVGDYFARGVADNLLGTTHAGTYAVKPGAFARYVPSDTRSIIDKWVDVTYDKGAFKAWPNLLKKLGAELTPEGILRGDQNITDNVLSYLMDHSELGNNRKAVGARYQQLLDELAPAVDEAVEAVDIPAVTPEVGTPLENLISRIDNLTPEQRTALTPEEVADLELQGIKGRASTLADMIRISKEDAINNYRPPKWTWTDDIPPPNAVQYDWEPKSGKPVPANWREQLGANADIPAAVARPPVADGHGNLIYTTDLPMTPQAAVARGAAAKSELFDDAADVAQAVPRAWPIDRADFDSMTLDVQKTGYGGTGYTKAGQLLSDDSDIIVYHGTDEDGAAKLLKYGVDPKRKPGNLARDNYEAGIPAEFGPGRGVSGGIYVAADPFQASQFGPVTVALRVKVRDIAPSPEQIRLGSEKYPATALGALRDNDAVVMRPVDLADLHVVGESRKQYFRLDDAFESMRAKVQGGSGDIAAGGGGGGGMGIVHPAIANMSENAARLLVGGSGGTIAGGGMGAVTGAGLGAAQGFIGEDGDLSDKLGAAFTGAKQGAETGATLGAIVGGVGGVTIGRNTTAEAARHILRGGWEAAKDTSGKVARPTSGLGHVKGLFSYWAGQTTSHIRNLFNDDLYGQGVTSALVPGAQKYLRPMREQIAQRQREVDPFKRLSTPVQSLLGTFGKGTDYLPDLGITIAKDLEDEAAGVLASSAYSTILSGINPGGFAQNAAGLLLGGPVKGAMMPAWRRAFTAVNHVMNRTFREGALVSEAGKFARQGRQALIDAGYTGFQQFADDGLFTAKEVAQKLGTREAAVWQSVQDAALELAEQRVKHLFGDYSDAGKKAWEKRLGTAIPFASWAIRAYPVVLEMALEHPLIALGVYHATKALSQGAGKDGRPGYTAGMIPIPDKAGLLTGGQSGTAYLDPVGAISPVGGDMFASQDEGYDKSVYQDVQQGLQRLGLPGFNPVIQSLAYIMGMDFKGPSALSRTQGLENALGLLPGNPDLPDIGGGALRAARAGVSPALAGTDIGAALGATADPTPEQYDPIGRRYAELVVQTTGKRLNDPTNKAYLIDLMYGRGELYERAEREALLGGAARNLASLSSPVGTVSQTDTARHAKQATSANPHTWSAVQAIPQGTPARRQAEQARKAALAADPWIEPYSIGGQAEAEDILLREIAERYRTAGARLTPAGLAEQLRLMEQRAERTRTR